MPIWSNRACYKPQQKDIYNRNFILTPKLYNKRKLNEELEPFYRLLKLKAYLKITETPN